MQDPFSFDPSTWSSLSDLFGLDPDAPNPKPDPAFTAICSCPARRPMVAGFIRAAKQAGDRRGPQKLAQAFGINERHARRMFSLNGEQLERFAIAHLPL